MMKFYFLINACITVLFLIIFHSVFYESELNNVYENFGRLHVHESGLGERSDLIKNGSTYVRPDEDIIVYERIGWIDEGSENFFLKTSDNIDCGRNKNCKKILNSTSPAFGAGVVQGSRKDQNNKKGKFPVSER